MAFTKEQKLAINSSGTNILISAGAGSGKTTVLSERVIRILSEGVDVDRLIILTFTNAAAAEMKARIKAKIAKNENLKSQLSKLENAKISTFDSFCLGLVKQYHYLLNLPESVEIADKILLTGIKNKLTEATLNDYYIEKPEWFVSVVDRFFDRGDQALIEVLKTLERGLEMIPEADGYLANLAEMMFSKENIAKSLNEFGTMIMDNVHEIQELYHFFIDEVNSSNNDRIIEYRDKLINALNPFFQSKSLDDVLINYQNVKFPVTPKVSSSLDEGTVEWVKSLVHPIKSGFDALKKQISSLMVNSLEEIKNALLETKPAIEAIVKIMIKYRQKLKQYQIEHHLFDFIDIMHLAIELIVQHQDIREDIRNKTYEIMVDEYQDTNDLQEYLVSLISNNNVFMVGDAKQSIYGFRSANPLNFIQKYHLYSSHDGGIAIDLNANFRSRKEVIDGINTLFNPIMSEEIGGIDYQNNQALKYGNTAYDQLNNRFSDYSPSILSYHLTKEDEDTQAVSEAKIIRNKIIEMMKRKTPVAYFTDQGLKYRDAKFQDFCILIDRKSDFPVFEKILTDAYIPVDSIADEEIVASTEILFFSQLLKLLKCYTDINYFKQYFKHAFYGVARSFVYQIEDDDIISLFLNYTFESPDDLKQLAHHPLFRHLHLHLVKLSEMIGNDSVAMMIDEIVKTTRIYDYIAQLDNPHSVERKLDFIFSKVRSFKQFQFDDLIAYFDQVYSEQDLDIEFSKPVDFSTDAVKIMTIHKSKGLEFPFCFYPALDKSLASQDLKQSTIFDKHYGLIIKAKNEFFVDTIWHNLNRNHRKVLDLSERIRLFYVALTRAKEKMFFLINAETDKKITINHDDDDYLPKSVRLSFKKYHDFFDALEVTNTWKVPVTAETILSFTKEDTISQPAKPIQYEPIRIEPSQVNKSHYSKTATVDFDALKQSKFKRGLEVHELFEQFDFYHPEKSLKHLSAPNQQIMNNFLDQPIVRNLNLGIIYQEYPFIDSKDGETKQGIIDFMVIYPDHVDIIDYKLKAIDDEAYLTQLKGYKEHIEKKTTKLVYLYLYSIIQNKMQKVEV